MWHLRGTLRDAIVMRILMPIDQSKDSLAAVNFVASRRALVGTDPDVRLIHAQRQVPRDIWVVVGHGKLRKIQDLTAERAFKPALRTLAEAGLVTQTISAIGVPGEEIARAASKYRVDLIVMAARGLTEAKGLFLGSVTGSVLAHSKVPLLILRGHQAPKKRPLRIGIAVDGSKYGLTAIRYVLKHTSLFGFGKDAEPAIRLIHVTPNYASYVAGDISGMAMPVYSADETEAMRAAECKAALDPARKLLNKANVEVEEITLSGNAGDQIAAYANSGKLDLLVMGSHGRGAFTAAIFGSVATRVAAKCRTPLLIIRRA
jgi:nucleotide-binding universal stress UspA family protein